MVTSEHLLRIRVADSLGERSMDFILPNHGYAKAVAYLIVMIMGTAKH